MAGSLLQVMETAVPGLYQLPLDRQKAEDILVEHSEKVEQALGESAENLPQLSNQDLQTVWPVYTRAIGEAYNHFVGFEGGLGKEGQNQKFVLCASLEVADQAEYKLLKEDEFGNMLFAKNAPEQLQPILISIFKQQMLQGPLCFQQMAKVSIFTEYREEQKTESSFKNYHHKLRPSFGYFYQEIINLVQ